MGALDGILVVAVEQAVAAPLATSRLCDAGARVIKVERPEGDFARGYDGFAAGESSYFTWLKQGKESITLDLKREDDAALLRAMLARADILVQNLAPGAIDRLGFGEDALREHNPRLIQCHISGYGAGNGTAPELQSLKAYDLLVQAEAGLISVSGSPGAPGRIGVSLCDIGTGMAAHAAILEALIERGITGQGKALHLSLFETMAEWMTVPLMQLAATGLGPEPAGLAHPSIAPYEMFTTGDGTRLLVAIQNDREWRRFCTAVLNKAHLADAPEFATNPQRVQNRAALRRTISKILGDMSGTEAGSRLTEAQLAWGRVNSTAELARHPALKTRALATSAGIPVPAPNAPSRPVTGSGRRARHRRAPKLGEHGAAIRAEFSVTP